MKEGLIPIGKMAAMNRVSVPTLRLYDEKELLKPRYIDPETGCLEKKFALPISGEYPKDIAMFPDGKHIAVANHESNTITTFTVDYEKNVLVQKGRPMKVETPNCILITKKGVH